MDDPISETLAARQGHSRMIDAAIRRQVQPAQESNSTEYRNRILRKIATEAGDVDAAETLVSPPRTRSAAVLESEFDHAYLAGTPRAASPAASQLARGYTSIHRVAAASPRGGRARKGKPTPNIGLAQRGREWATASTFALPTAASFRSMSPRGKAVCI